MNEFKSKLLITAVILTVSICTAQDKTVTLSGVATNVRIAMPDEQVAIGGRIYTVQQLMDFRKSLTEIRVIPAECLAGKKYVVSFPMSMTVREVCADSRLEAAAKSGITVWTETEWKAGKP